jgi:dTDP-4-amino-4,6-dideoxygalactose transaminase
MVPLFDITRQYQNLKPELDAAAIALLASGQYVLGPAVEEFEAAAAKAIGVKHAVGVANGTDALEIALRALGLREGDEVITTPFSFIASAEVVADLGAVPVFVDIELDTFNIDPALIEAAITPRTRAIVPVHLFGHPAPMAEIKAIAARHGIPVIEDTAQGWGASIDGAVCGSIGEAGTFSFFPTKNLGACGEGGLITTNQDSVAEMARMLRAHGQRRRYIHDEIGYNSRLHALQAAILSVKLPHADEWNRLRRKNAARYAELLEGTPLILPTERPGAYHVYHQYTLRVPSGINRDKITDALTAAQIGWAIYYPVPLHQQPVFAKLGFHSPSLPKTEQAAAEVLSLPIFPEMRADEVETVASVLRQVL